MIEEVCIALGSNLGDRRGNIVRALDEITLSRDIQFLGVSSLYQTSAVGMDGDNLDFFNIVARVTTGLEPTEFFDLCTGIERKFGRERKPGSILSRTIDIDIIFWGERKISNSSLEIPHPRYESRLFVLVPLLEVLGQGSLDPVTRKPIEDHLTRVRGEGSQRIEKFEGPGFYLGKECILNG